MSEVGAKVLGVVGLGSMGFGAAGTALRKGVSTVGLDTRAEARARFEAKGGAAREVLRPVTAGELPANRPTGEVLREAVRAANPHHGKHARHGKKPAGPTSAGSNDPGAPTVE